jgi:hypothetical protein
MEEEQTRTSLLINIIEQLRLINSKLDIVLEKAPNNSEPMKEIDIMTLLDLPKSHRKTVMALYKLKKATASQIATETGRLRAFESSIANDLVRLGYLQKNRNGHETIFTIEKGAIS